MSVERYARLDGLPTGSEEDPAFEAAICGIKAFIPINERRPLWLDQPARRGQYKACATDIAQQNPTNYGFLLEIETERPVTRKFLLGSKDFLAGENYDVREAYLVKRGVRLVAQAKYTPVVVE